MSRLKLDVKLEVGDSVRQLVAHILHWLGCRRDASARFNFAVTVESKLPKEPRMLEITLTTEQQARVVCKPVSLKGKPVALDGPISATTDDTDITVTVEGTDTVLITTPDVPGDRTVIIKGDADLGAGVVEIQDVVVLHVGDPQAAQLGLTHTVEPKP